MTTNLFEFDQNPMTQNSRWLSQPSKCVHRQNPTTPTAVTALLDFNY